MVKKTFVVNTGATIRTWCAWSHMGTGVVLDTDEVQQKIWICEVRKTNDKNTHNVWCMTIHAIEMMKIEGVC